MTIDAGEPGLEVPVSTVGPPRRDRRRAAIVTVALIAVVGGAIALSRTSQVEEPVAVRPTAAASSAASDQVAITTPAPFPPPTAPLDLPVVENVPLLDAPTPALIVRVGRSAQVLAWIPGDPKLYVARTFENAYSAITRDNGYVMLSPDGRLVASLTQRSSGTAGGDSIKVVSEGGVLWRQDGVTGGTGAAWWGGSRRLAVAGGTASWVLADIDEDGVTGREVDVPAASLDVLENGGLAPVGFSADGESVITGYFDEAARTVHAAYRLGFADGAVDPLATFPTGGPGGLEAEQEFGLVDPIGGRTFTFPQFGDGSEPPRLEILAPDGTTLFEVDSRYVIRAMWDRAGRLAILEADHFDGPSPLRLLSVDRDGTTTQLFETPTVARGALLGVRDGYAGVLLQVDDPPRSQLLLVGMIDGIVSGIDVGELGIDGPGSAGWLP